MFKERGELPQVTSDTIDNFFVDIMYYGENDPNIGGKILRIDSPHVQELYPGKGHLLALTNSGLDIPLYFSANDSIRKQTLSIHYRSTETAIQLDTNHNFVGIAKPHWEGEQNWRVCESGEAIAQIQEEIWLNEENSQVLEKIDGWYPNEPGKLHGKLIEVNFRPYGANHTLNSLYHFDRYKTNTFRLLGSKVIEHHAGVISQSFTTEVPQPGQTAEATLPNSGSYEFPMAISLDTMMQNALYPPTYHPDNRNSHTIQHNYWGINKVNN